MDEHTYQESYFAAFSKVISNLDQNAADFEFQLSNLRHAARISTLLAPAEQLAITQMIHIKYVQSKSERDISMYSRADNSF